MKIVLTAASCAGCLWRCHLMGTTVLVGVRALGSADRFVVACPFAVAEHELLDLAGGGFRQRPEFDRVGAFVVGEALAAERDDLLRGRGGGVVEGDECLGP